MMCMSVYNVCMGDRRTMLVSAVGTTQLLEPPLMLGHVLTSLLLFYCYLKQMEEISQHSMYSPATSVKEHKCRFKGPNIVQTMEGPLNLHVFST